MNSKNTRHALLIAAPLAIFLGFVFTSIGFLILNQDISTAFVLFFGIGGAVSIVVYALLTRKYIKRANILRKVFPSEWDAILKQEVAYYTTLTDADKESFRRRLQIFLSEVDIIGVETEVDDEVRLLVGVSAIIPVFRFPEWEYRNLTEVLIYPDNFDDNFDFESKKGRILGMVGIGSSMILSKKALIGGFRNPADKENVGVHEFVHKIDGMDGVIDGIPGALITPSIAREWQSIVANEMEKGASDINPYGYTNASEFFAVVSEYFFEKPDAMRDKHPAMYDILTRIYKQDTRSQLKGVLSSFFRVKHGIGRNSPCPCGSGEKYKKCCLRKSRGANND